jgi:hypothetical protein
LIRHLLLDDRLMVILDSLESEVDGHLTDQDRQLRADWEEEQQVLADSWGLLEIDDERRRQIVSKPHRPQALNVAAMQALQRVIDWDTATIMGEQGEEQVDALLAAQGAALTVSLAAGDTLPTRKHEAEILRDIFGNPFHPVPIDPVWLTWNDGTATKIAQGIYEEKAFDRMPILADALEEAGCTNRDILAHCRSGGEHVRGCWAVDLILGRP